jgi:hypothetical protein
LGPIAFLIIALHATNKLKFQKEQHTMMVFWLLFILALIAVLVILILALMGKLGNNKSEKH